MVETAEKADIALSSQVCKDVQATVNCWTVYSL